jgi:hypothetical protein
LPTLCAPPPPPPLQIRLAYPGAAIIQMVWPMEVQLLLASDQSAPTERKYQRVSTYLQYMAAAASRLQARFDRVYSLQLVGEEIDNSSYCLGHPDAATHAVVAAQLIQFIEAALPTFGAPGSVAAAATAVAA